MNNSTNYNAQRGFQGSSIMNAIGEKKRMLCIIHAIVGGVLLGIGTLILALHFFLDHNAPGHSLLIVGGSLIFSGVVELIVSALIRRFVHHPTNRQGVYDYR